MTRKVMRAQPHVVLLAIAGLLFAACRPAPAVPPGPCTLEPSSPCVSWVVDTPPADAATVGPLLVVVDPAGGVHAVNASSGQKLWTGTEAVPQGRVVDVGREDRVVVGGPVATAVFDAGSGRLLLHRYASPVPAAVTQDGPLLLASSGELTAWDLGSGDQLSQEVHDGDALAAGDDGVVVVELPGDGLFLRAPFLEGAWKVTPPGSELAAVGRYVYMALPDDAADFANGHLLVALDPEAIGQPDNPVVWGTGRAVEAAALAESVLVVDHGGEVVGHDAATGRRLWARSGLSLRPSPVATERLLADAALDDGAGLAMLDPATGQSYWEAALGLPAGDEAVADVLVDGDLVAGVAPDGWFVVDGSGTRTVVAVGDSAEGRVLSVTPLVVTDGRRVYGLRGP